MNRRTFLAAILGAPLVKVLPVTRRYKWREFALGARVDKELLADGPVGFVLDSSRLDSGDYLVSYVTV